MNINKITGGKSMKKLLNYRGSYITIGAIFVLMFSICLTVLNFASFKASGMAMNIVRIITYFAAFVCIIMVCVRCSKANKANYSDDISKSSRDTFYYLKRLGFDIIMVVLMSLAFSLIGLFINGIFGGIINNAVSNSFLKGFVLKLPLFVLYLSFIYKMFIRYGFMDSQKKIFNLDLKTIAMVIALILMIPDAVYDSMFYTSFTDSFILNIQTVLSPNISAYIIESDGYFYFNENFNIFWVLITVFITFVIQTAIARFAYKRGKKIFIKEHIRKLDEYAMDENI